MTSRDPERSNLWPICT